MDQPTTARVPTAAADPRTRRYVLILVSVAVLFAIWGIVTRLSARIALEKQASAAGVATVTTTKPHAGPGSDKLVLPGSVQAFYEAPIYARTNGYLKVWNTDIGTPVKKGQLLALIDTPEVDQELLQAQADLATAAANYQLARTTNDRWQGLLSTESVSQQDADQRAGDAAAKAAARQSAAANVARLRELESFKRVLAPFDGIVTQRNTDVGALINAGQSAGNALFRVADVHRLRIYVSVPQPYASAIHPGLSAELEFADHPGRLYQAVVANSAQALDAISRTLQVELQIDNAKGELLPGSYAQVYFTLAGVDNTLRIPVNTVLFRTDGLRVAVLDEQHRVHLRSITEGRDFGTEIEVLSGLTVNDVLVANPPDSISDGMQVRLAPPAPNAGAPAGTGHT
ncbi:MAG: efflux RND transporter periplasmic adaptor subunit [Steroidobacteraceae bacterium]